MSFLLWTCGLCASVALLTALLVVYALVVALPKLPSLDALIDYRPKIPLRIYTADHVLIGEFGEERRRFVRLADTPPVLRQAVLAIEDYRFYEHGGIDPVGIFRAGMANFTRGGTAQGASTITMQVARNVFLSSEKTYTRKLYEMLLAYKIEAALTKDQILEIYMNQIYLGRRAYGFASAARVYFGVELKDITLAQAAMLAGLPKAPSANNPLANFKRAKQRQAYILKRMLALRDITPAQYEAALAEPIRLNNTGAVYSVHAEYVAETVRQMMVDTYREEAYAMGLNVVTTIDSADQRVAYDALRKGILDYEKRRGYRGPEGFVALPASPDERDQAIGDALSQHPDNGEIVAGVVTAIGNASLRAELANGDEVALAGEALKFAAPALAPRATPALRLRVGSIVRLARDERLGWQITQLPQVEGAFVALRPADGAVRALVGGFDFGKNHFNHVTQAWRQPGSSFKPFIYAAALDAGLGPATIINDAPLSFSATETGGRPWQPKNYGGRYDGPISLRTALERSRNLVSIRILDYIKPRYAQGFITRFGFDASRHPAYLPMALGAGTVTPLQMAKAYGIFANGGYGIDPYLIDEVSDARGAVLARAQPATAGNNAPRVLDPRNQYVMTDLLQGVAQRGTAARSNALGRSDLAGKTGTTNDSHDAWFAGFQHTLAAVAWMGYDQPRTLGNRETGGGLALPIWMDYMRQALRGVPTYRQPMPEGVVSIDGELYYDTFTPGHGFIASLDSPTHEGIDGIDGSDGTDDSDTPALPVDESETAALKVGDDEKRYIIDLFSQP